MKLISGRLDWTSFDLIDLPVIHYFTYSNSLSNDENAYLYTNLCKNEASYGKIVRSYQPKIKMFVLDSVKQERISDLYAYLYQKYLPHLIREDRMIAVLPNIIFKKKIVCSNPFMQTVVVKHLEKEQPDVYEMKDGTAYCDIYSDCFMLVFYDKEGNPYISSISWKMESVLDEERYYEICRQTRYLRVVADQGSEFLQTKDVLCERRYPDGASYAEFTNDQWRIKGDNPGAAFGLLLQK